MDSNFILTLVLFAIPFIFAVTFHEAAHGYVARKFGDRTAEMMGRITLNPIKHIDPIGTLLVPGMMFLMAKMVGAPFFLFGWAKPVPINPSHFRDPVRNMRWVTAAGPLSNLAMALIWAVVWKLSMLFPGMFAIGMIEMATFGVLINVLLMVLNLIPILPLDGGRIVDSFLPWKWSMSFRRIEPYGIWILLLLLVFGGLGKVLWPLVNSIIGLIRMLVGL
ncbi:MAG: site-2 protease family protein [Burkholderiales bacterium]|jgi:Zn-dependent protease|nr:site-2 protease family protein [Burkholderiales bacterium]